MSSYPLGQPVRISTTVTNTSGNLVTPTTLTLTVALRNDDGTTTVTGTYASPVQDSVGNYHQDVPPTDLTTPGDYLYTWASTGTGEGVSDPGEFEVFDPFAPPVTTTLATPDDVAARLGRSLTTAETARVGALLDDASAQIRRYCRRDFLLHNDVTQTLHGHDSLIWLPQYPVQSVSTVVAVSGWPGIPNFPIPWFSFDGIRTVRIAPGTGIINLPELWWTSEYFPQTFQVTYSYGYSQVPYEVVMVAANAALGVLTAPTAAAGVIGETIGPYSYRLESGGGGVAVALTQADLAILKDFRNTANTIQAELR